MLHWPKRALSAIARLYRPLQDIDIYVEDGHDEPFYTELIARIAPAGVRIAQVFCVGHRQAVIEKARSHDFAARRALFLIDGDLEWVRGADGPAVVGVYRLDAYCIENLLVRESTCIQVLMEQAILVESDARAALDFQRWFSELSRLAELFAVYAALNELDRDQPTVSLGLSPVISERGKGVLSKFDSAKAEAHIAHMQAHLVAIGGSAAQERLDAIRSRIEKLPDALDAVSGKDYILPLFLRSSPD